MCFFAVICMNYIILSLCVINVIMFFAFGYDKVMAVRKGRRVPEFWLVTLSFVFCGLGSALGMIVFNHKTSKAVFRFLIPLSVFVNLPVASFIFV